MPHHTECNTLFQFYRNCQRNATVSTIHRKPRKIFKRKTKKKIDIKILSVLMYEFISYCLPSLYLHSHLRCFFFFFVFFMCPKHRSAHANALNIRSKLCKRQIVEMKTEKYVPITYAYGLCCIKSRWMKWTTCWTNELSLYTNVHRSTLPSSMLIQNVMASTNHSWIDQSETESCVIFFFLFHVYVNIDIEHTHRNTVSTDLYTIENSKRQSWFGVRCIPKFSSYL